MDRRYNPRYPFYIFKHLNGALPEIEDGIEVRPIKADRNVRVFLIRSQRHKTILVLFKKKTKRIEIMATPDEIDIDQTKWFSLYTGRVVQFVRTKTEKNRRVMTLPEITQDPGLLIFDD